MGSGKIQLLIKGNDDQYLVGNPEISFFKFIYKKYTNFAIEYIKQNFSTSAPTFSNREVSVLVSKSGDLMSKTYLELDLPIFPNNNTDLYSIEIYQKLSETTKYYINNFTYKPDIIWPYNTSSSLKNRFSIDVYDNSSNTTTEKYYYTKLLFTTDLSNDSSDLIYSNINDLKFSISDSNGNYIHYKFDNTTTIYDGENNNSILISQSNPVLNDDGTVASDTGLTGNTKIIFSNNLPNLSYYGIDIDNFSGGSSTVKATTNLKINEYLDLNNLHNKSFTIKSNDASSTEVTYQFDNTKFDIFNNYDISFTIKKKNLYDGKTLILIQKENNITLESESIASDINFTTSKTVGVAVNAGSLTNKDYGILNADKNIIAVNNYVYIEGDVRKITIIGNDDSAGTNYAKITVDSAFTNDHAAGSDIYYALIDYVNWGNGSDYNGSIGVIKVLSNDTTVLKNNSSLNSQTSTIKNSSDTSNSLSYTFVFKNNIDMNDSGGLDGSNIIIGIQNITNGVDVINTIKTQIDSKFSNYIYTSNYGNLPVFYSKEKTNLDINGLSITDFVNGKLDNYGECKLTMNKNILLDDSYTYLNGLEIYFINSVGTIIKYKLKLDNNTDDTSSPNFEIALLDEYKSTEVIGSDTEKIPMSRKNEVSSVIKGIYDFINTNSSENSCENYNVKIGIKNNQKNNDMTLILYHVLNETSILSGIKIEYNYIIGIKNASNSNKYLDIVDIVYRITESINNCTKNKSLYNNGLQINVINISGPKWIREIGHYILEDVEIIIGDQLIDKHYSDWLSIWTDLTISESKRESYNNMIGNVKSVYNNNIINSNEKYRIYIPFNFWFCKYNNLALPLLAIKYSDIKFNIKIREYKYLVWNTNTRNNSVDITNCNIWVKYIFLDDNERALFTKSNHEYLIEQVQRNVPYIFNYNDNINFEIKLKFKHPVKEIFWIIKLDSYSDTTNLTSDYGYDTLDLGNYGTYYAYNSDEPDFGENVKRENQKNLLKEGYLIINNQKILEKMDANYFNWVQPFNYHTNSPRVGINMYSFALHPENHQPSGCLNFSKIDNCLLKLNIDNTNWNQSYINKTTNSKIYVYALNYNILKISNGYSKLIFN